MLTKGYHIVDGACPNMHLPTVDANMYLITSAVTDARYTLNVMCYRSYGLRITRPPLNVTCYIGLSDWSQCVTLDVMCYIDVNCDTIECHVLH